MLTTDMPEAAALDAAILEQKTALLYRNAGLAQGVTVINACILAYAVSQTAPPLVVVAWWLAAIALAAYRYGLSRRFAALGVAGRDAENWSRRWIKWATVAGILWGGGGAIFSWNATDALR